MTVMSCKIIPYEDGALAYSVRAVMERNPNWPVLHSNYMYVMDWHNQSAITMIHNDCSGHKIL